MALRWLWEEGPFCDTLQAQPVAFGASSGLFATYSANER